MKFFVIIWLILVAATLGMAFPGVVPDVVLWVAIGVTAFFGIIMFAFIIKNLKKK